jgi:DNA-binding CsgD family transcriptional regulator
MSDASPSAREGTTPTDRELQVLRLWRETGTATAAAASLGITVDGVRAALSTLRARAGVGTTEEAADRYLGPHERSPSVSAKRIPVSARG